MSHQTGYASCATQIQLNFIPESSNMQQFSAKELAKVASFIHKIPPELASIDTQALIGIIAIALRHQSCARPATL
ncbi:hypothetical protein KYU16_000724 [Listeria monocytogenes]|nr:hypothetical protein [Listeria monocytogenes]